MQLRKMLLTKLNPKTYHTAVAVNMLFLPGMFLIVGGILALLMPKFFIAILAAFLILLGVSLSFLAWKVMQFKRQVEAAIRGFEGRFQIEAYPLDDPFAAQFKSEKKVTFH